MMRMMALFQSEAVTFVLSIYSFSVKFLFWSTLEITFVSVYVIYLSANPLSACVSNSVLMPSFTNCRKSIECYHTAFGVEREQFGKDLIA